MSPSPPHIVTREAMKVAGKIWQRSRQSLPAAGSYIQPWAHYICMEYVIINNTVIALEKIAKPA